jgi:hypothetical protein
MKTLRLYLKTTSGYKQDLMRSFGIGAEKHGVKVDYFFESQFIPSDYAMIFAYKSDDVGMPSHNLRQAVVDNKKDKQIFFIDSNVLRHYEKDKKYFRLPYKSIHPHEADFLRVNERSFEKVKQVKKDLGIELKPWRKTGEHILLSLNRGSGGFSSFGRGCYDWAREIIQKIRLYTDRPILIRSHKHAKITDKLIEDKKHLDWIMKNIKNIKHTSLGETSLTDDLKNAWATVVFTTTSGAVSLVEGIPVFTTHPACFYKMFGSGDIAQIETPNLPNRDMFLTQYANAHWTQEEMENGVFWDKFKKQHYDFSI